MAERRTERDEDQKSPPADENQKAADRAAQKADEKQRQLREEGVGDDVPATGGAVKRMQGVHGAAVDRKAGEAPSDAIKRANQEAIGDDVGEADAASVESGALMETGIKQKVTEQLGHPAVDNRPRLGLPPESNQIDFNDPRLRPEEGEEEPA